MKLNEYIDHTFLRPTGTLADIDTLIDEAIQYQFKSVCVHPVFVPHCRQRLEGTGVRVCTVVGFPLGQNTTATKVFETLNAIHNGADEIDMVINIGDAKTGHWERIKEEIDEVVKAAGNHLVKVIIETCYLSKEEIIEVSKTVAKTQAGFIKTSTGFGPEGAKVEDVKLMKEYGAGKEVKASGGVRSQADLVAMIQAGATRIGTSSGVKLLRDAHGDGY